MLVYYNLLEKYLLPDIKEKHNIAINCWITDRAVQLEQVQSNCVTKYELVVMKEKTLERQNRLNKWINRHKELIFAWKRPGEHWGASIQERKINRRDESC